MCDRNILLPKIQMHSAISFAAIWFHLVSSDAQTLYEFFFYEKKKNKKNKLNELVSLNRTFP